ncbi:MAG: DUF5071 domain-containing protein [Pirellulaceae bacterium]|nr:DUF5071 domain-containing protein [Pirellulaceae bacterium]
MTIDDDLIIRSKFDCEKVDRLIQRGYPAVAAHIPNMFQWLQDMNWPVAKKLAPFLLSIGEPICPEIRRVFDGDDPIWKYWVIVVLLTQLPPELVQPFRPDLERLATSPTPAEQAELLDEAAADLLDQLDSAPN